MNTKKIIIGISIGSALLIVGALVYLLIPRSSITFSTAPQEVTITIDGKAKQTLTNGQTLKVSPGRHTISVSRDEFGPYVKEIDIKNHQTMEFLVALEPKTEAAKQLLHNDKSQAVMQRFYGKTFTKQTDDITKNYPILSELPIHARLYTIAACPSKKYPNDTTKIALCVDLYHADLEPYVLKDIRSRHYNPDDYEIIWNNRFSKGE